MFKFLKKSPTISANDLVDRLKRKHILIDVRTPNEYYQGHINTARHLPLDHIQNYSQKTDETIYVICQSGMRSKKAARILKSNGYNVINVQGGMNQWRGPIKRGK